MAERRGDDGLARDQEDESRRDRGREILSREEEPREAQGEPSHREEEDDRQGDLRGRGQEKDAESSEDEGGGRCDVK